MELEHDQFIFAIACGLIAAGAYAPLPVRDFTARITAAMTLPLVVSGAASTALNAVGVGAAGVGFYAALDRIITHIVTPMFMCKLLLVRLFVFLGMLPLYLWHARNKTGEAIITNPQSALTTPMYRACASYFQDTLGTETVPGDGPKSPYLLTVSFLASLAIHLPCSITGPPIVFSSLANQAVVAYRTWRGGEKVNWGPVPTVASVGEMSMWAFSTAMYFVDQDVHAYTHSIATAFYIMGNANFNCLMVSIFARFFAPTHFFMPPSQSQFQSLGGGGAGGFCTAVSGVAFAPQVPYVPSEVGCAAAGATYTTKVEAFSRVYCQTHVQYAKRQI